MTSDKEILDESWYWIKTYRNPSHWVVMQAQVSSYDGEIEWWEVMKDWATQHNEIFVVGPRILPPKQGE